MRFCQGDRARKAENRVKLTRMQMSPAALRIHATVSVLFAFNITGVVS
jgi:hypothetical protein